MTRTGTSRGGRRGVRVSVRLGDVARDGGVDATADENGDGSDDDRPPSPMPVDGDPYEALLDDDPDCARPALVASSSDRDWTIARVSRHLREGACRGVLQALGQRRFGDVPSLQRRRARRSREGAGVSRGETRGEALVGAQPGDARGAARTCCSSTRDATCSADGRAHERLREQLLSNIARFTSRDYSAWTWPARRRTGTRVAARAGEPDLRTTVAPSGRTSKPPASRTNSSETPRTTCAARASAS